MQFSLRVICNGSIIESVKPRVTELIKYLGLFDNYVFSPYWKDENCSILEIHTCIEKPDYSRIQQYLQFISRMDNPSLCSSSGDWECAYYVHLNELHTDKDIAFVICNIF